MRYLNMLADDKNLITYRPKLNKITGSVTSTILLQQILYWYKLKGYKPFYKFKEPCPSNELYKVGDSWCEELGFSRSEFDLSIKNIGQKINKNDKRDLNKLVHYWIDSSRKTFYEINVKLFEEKLNELYNDELSQNPALRKADNGDTYSNFSALYNTETTTETTTEITTENKKNIKGSLHEQQDNSKYSSIDEFINDIKNYSDNENSIELAKTVYLAFLENIKCQHYKLDQKQLFTVIQGLNTINSYVDSNFKVFKLINSYFTEEREYYTMYDFLGNKTLPYLLSIVCGIELNNRFNGKGTYQGLDL